MAGLDLWAAIDKVNVRLLLKRLRQFDWLNSGLSVKDSKTEMCLFHKNDHLLVEIIINGITVKSKQRLNVQEIYSK
jgi:hypothetical protein